MRGGFMTTTQNRALLPIAMVNAFWNEVEKALRREHLLTSVQALRAILRYRNQLDSFDIGHMLYQSAPFEVARHIITEGYTKA
jgi:hypothetical protein